MASTMLSIELEGLISHTDQMLIDGSSITTSATTAMFVDGVLLRLKTWQDEMEPADIATFDQGKEDEALRGLHELTTTHLARIRDSLVALNTEFEVETTEGRRTNDAQVP